MESCTELNLGGVGEVVVVCVWGGGTELSADETELRTPPPPPPMRQGAEGRMSEVGEEGGCPDATRGAAATSGTHVRESSGFYPATRPLAPHPLSHTRYDLRFLRQQKNSPRQMAARRVS